MEKLVECDQFGFLRSIIHKWKKDFNSTTKALALKSGIPQSTLSKIENLQKKPQLEEVLKILAHTGCSGKIPKVLEKISPDIKEEFLRSALESDRQLLAERISRYLSEPDYFLIVLYAYAHEGTLRSKIKQELGERGDKKTQELIDKGIISQEGNKIKAIQHDHVSPNQARLRDLMVNCLRTCYKPENFGKQNNTLRFYQYNVNKKVFDKIIYREFKECIQRLSKMIEENPLLHGDDSVFFGVVYDDLRISIESE